MKQFLFILLCFPSFLFAQTEDLSQLFQQANQAYEAGEYNQAINSYKTILKQGKVSTDLYYNLGNAFYKNDQLGYAILSYEKGLKLNPNDKDLINNLKFAQQLRVDNIPSISPFFLSAWWNTTKNMFSATVWGILAIIMAFTGIAGLLLWMFSDVRKKKKRGFIGGVVFVLLTILTFSLGFSKLQTERDSGKAIVITTAKLHKSLDANSPTIMELHEGTKVSLVERVNTWYKVRLSNGEVGWLTKKNMEQI